VGTAATLLTHRWAARRSSFLTATRSAQRSHTCTIGMEGVEQSRCGAHVKPPVQILHSWISNFFPEDR
jgi:hypothetical protein